MKNQESISYPHKEVEEKWLSKWQKTLYSDSSDYTKATDSDKPKYFAMDTFAYPSAEGVHVGYVESFGATDLIARYHRMNGYNVFYPMGYDTFGLPAENYAIKTGIHPKEATDKSIKNIQRQYRRMGLSYDRDTYINTAEPEYYRWTQWLFLKLYENDLAYRDREEVGYCPECKTVISKEQTIDEGFCERCGAEVEIKKLTQWYFKITEYADRLYEGIAKLDWPETGKKLHKYWIGREKKKGKTKFRLHDWCLSRQRYWGTPIPIVYCKECGEQSVPYEKLPVELPYDVDFIPTGVSPLKKHKEFYEGGVCPKCGGHAKREVDVMDTFVSSSWYMYRYFDTKNSEEPFDPSRVNGWFPINWYQGSSEHYTAHLVYARFIAMFLYDIGYLDVEEPVKSYVGCGLVVDKDGGKFSKRLANAPDLDEEIKNYGIDALRLFTQFAAPFEDNVPWDTKAIPGIVRLLDRIYRIAVNKVDGNSYQVSKATKVAYNQTINSMEDSFEEYKWNVAISKIMVLVKEIDSHKKVDIELWNRFIRLLAPFAPFITEELWEMIGEVGSVHEREYPEKYEVVNMDEDKTIVVTVDGDKKGEIQVSKEDSEEEIVSQAMEEVKKYGVSRENKYVYVEGELVNFVR